MDGIVLCDKCNCSGMLWKGDLKSPASTYLCIVNSVAFVVRYKFPEKLPKFSEVGFPRHNKLWNLYAARGGMGSHFPVAQIVFPLSETSWCEHR